MSTPSGPSSNPEVVPKRPLRAANLSALRDRSLYPLMINFILFLIPVVLMTYGWGFFERTHKAPVEYYAVNNDKLYRMRALNQPNLTTEAILSWAVEAATTCYTFDFYNYSEVMKSVRGYFTEPGYASFTKAIASAHVIDSIVKKKLVISAVPTDTPIILREGPTSDGVYAWQIQFPMLLTYLSASEHLKQNIILTLLIARVPTTDSVKGIGIASFIVKEGTAIRGGG